VKNVLVAALTSFSICACPAVSQATPTIVMQPKPSALSGAEKAARSASLKAELEALFDSNRKARDDYKIGMDQKAMRAMWEKTQIADAANQARLDELVREHGWPEKKDVGAKAAYAAFIVVQHAPHEMMKRYFPMIQKAVERGDLPKAEFARFDDRLRMDAGQPQRYGTQTITDINGITTFWPIEDEANVDKRRAEVGYEPLAEQARRYKVQYVPYAERVAKELAVKSEAKE
jgi:hypothetical protein